MNERFAGRAVLVTGAGGGLGRAFAQRFSAEGASLILTDVDERQLAETADTVREASAGCMVYRADLADERDIHRFAAEVSTRHPSLDVLVNNAGLAYGDIAHRFADLDQQAWLRFLSINTLAPLLLAQALRPALAAAGGTVINISSMAGFVPATAYGVTKSALNAMTFGMAQHFGADGIRVNAIAPGIVETPASTAQLPPGTFERIHSQQAIRTVGAAEDIAALGAWLASGEARLLTGEIVSCDGGNRIRGWRS